MKERLLEFLRKENKSSAQLAEEIGVQPSGISHILSGRNNPSLDFVLRMLEKYPFLSTDWFLFGKGQMYNDKEIRSLFDEDSDFGQSAKSNSAQSENEKIKPPEDELISPEPVTREKSFDTGRKNSISRIVWFYNDNSFEEYFPLH